MIQKYTVGGATLLFAYFAMGCGSSDAPRGDSGASGTGSGQASGSGAPAASGAGAGSGTSGSGAAGSGSAGSGSAGSGVAGSGIAGSGVAGSGVAGSGIAGSGVAGSGVAGSGVAGSDAGLGDDANSVIDGQAPDVGSTPPEGGTTHRDASSAGPLPWPLANQIVNEIVQPTFPAANFNVTDYGAKCDATTDNTLAFQQAISACSKAGGGHVVVPAGTCVVGAITLLSNVDLHLSSPQTILQFSGDVSKYPLVLTRFRGTELINHSPMIYAYGQKNIAVTGSGTIDLVKTAAFQFDSGSGVALVTGWGQMGTPVNQRVLPAGSTLRSPSIEPYASDTILIQGVTINNGQFWNIHLVLSKNVTVDGVTIFATAQETDGCNPESSDHVLIENVTFRTGDDAVAIKSGRDNDGRRIHTPSTNIVVQHVHFDDNYGILAIGSEESGGVAHVFGYDMTAADNSNRGVGLHFQYALFMKANWDRGGVVDDVHLDTIKMSNISGPVVFGDLTYNNITTGPFPPQFGNISLSHVVINGAAQVLDVVATPTHPFGAIAMDTCTFTNVTNTTNTLVDVQPAPVLTNVTVNGQPAH